MHTFEWGLRIDWDGLYISSKYVHRYHMKGTDYWKSSLIFVTKGGISSANYAGILRRLIMQGLLCDNHF